MIATIFLYSFCLYIRIKIDLKEYFFCLYLVSFKALHNSPDYSVIAGYMDEERIVIEEASGGAESDKAYAAGNSLKVLEAI